MNGSSGSYSKASEDYNYPGDSYDNEYSNQDVQNDTQEVPGAEQENTFAKEDFADNRGICISGKANDQVENSWGQNSNTLEGDE